MVAAIEVRVIELDRTRDRRGLTAAEALLEDFALAEPWEFVPWRRCFHCHHGLGMLDPVHSDSCRWIRARRIFGLEP